MGLPYKDVFPPLLPATHDGLSGPPPFLPHLPTTTHTDTTVVGTASLLLDLGATLQQMMDVMHQMMMEHAAEARKDFYIGVNFLNDVVAGF